MTSFKKHLIAEIVAIFLISLIPYKSFSISNVGKKEMAKTWAIVVGVSRHYTKKSLHFSDDSAYRMYAYFKSYEGQSLPNEQAVLLVDENALKENVLAALTNVVSQAGENDKIVFFFSGYGDNESIHLLGSANEKKYLLHEEIVHVLKKSRTETILTIFDIIHEPSSTKSYFLAFEETSISCLLACQPTNVTKEDTNLRQSIFSHFLVKGLKEEADENKDKKVTIYELFVFVQEEVQKYTNNKQTPIYYKNKGRNTVIGITR